MGISHTPTSVRALHLLGAHLALPGCLPASDEPGVARTDDTDVGAPDDTVLVDSDAVVMPAQAWIPGYAWMAELALRPGPRTRRAQWAMIVELSGRDAPPTVTAPVCRRSVL